MTKPLAVIAGAGVAGLAAAVWLDRIGWRTLLVERSADLRQGGYIMGLSGPGHEAARRLGILPQLEAVARDIDENVYYNRDGREILRLRYREFLADLPYLVLRRTDLVNVLRNIAAPVAEIRLATTVDAFENGADKVAVTLSSGDTVEADLLIGADGFRSVLRRQAFGPDDDFLAPLGYRFAAYDLTDDLNLGLDFLSYSMPGQLAEYYTLSKGRLAALHVWKSAATGPVAPEHRWDLLKTIGARSHPNVLRTMEKARGGPLPIVDDMSLVTMPGWSTGRVVLLGDAAHCLTLVSGQGAGLAMASAAILADCLSGHEVEDALARHEQRLRPAVNRLQDRSRKMAAWFIPGSPFAYRMRNVMLRHMPRRLLARYFLNAVKSEIVAADGLQNAPAALDALAAGAALDGCPLDRAGRS